MRAELTIFLIAMSPFAELRGAIPIGITVFHFSWLKTFLISFLGNIIFIIPVILFLEHFSDFLMKKNKWFYKCFTWIFNRTRKQISASYQKYSRWALTIFVAVPLPFTGAWTGCIAAYLLGFSKRESFLLISLGVFIAACIVTTLTLLGVSLL